MLQSQLTSGGCHYITEWTIASHGGGPDFDLIECVDYKIAYYEECLCSCLINKFITFKSIGYCITGYNSVSTPSIWKSEQGILIRSRQ